MGGLCQPTTTELPSHQNVVAGTEIPEWVSQAGQDVWANAQSLAQQPYQQYTGPRVAGLNQDEQAGINAVRDQSGLWQDPLANAGSALGGASSALGQGLSGLSPYQGAINQGLNMAQGGQQDIDAARGGLDMATNAVMGGTQQWGQSAADQYMNPYTQNVTDIAAREMNRNYDMQRNIDNGAAAAGGAFGGSRHALLNAENERNRNLALGDVYAKGQAGAYNNAQQAFNADQARQLQGANIYQQGANTSLGVANQGLNAANTMFQGAGAGFAGQDRYLAGAQGYGDIAQGYSQLGATGQNLAYQDAGALQQMGQLQRDLTQRGYNTAYGDFQEQQAYPYQQTNFAIGALKGVPYDSRTFQNTNGVTTQLGASPLGQVAGATAGTIGALNYFGR